MLKIRGNPIALSLFLLNSIALAHDLGQAPDSLTWWQNWSWSPLVILNLFIISALYVKGYRRTREKGGVSTGEFPRAIAFAFGIVFLFVALVSPIDVYSEVLASVHMVQHTILMMIAAPLFVLGRPGPVIFNALPILWRRKLALLSHKYDRLNDWIKTTRPFIAFAIYGVTLWIWHLPVLYEAALKHSLIHDLQHLSFFITAALFWWALLQPFQHRQLDYGVGILYLFVASLHSTALGALMAVSPRLWYSHYGTRTQVFGLSPVEDQQLAGYIMWMPAGVSYVVAAVVLLLLWMARSDSGKSGGRGK